MENYNFFNFIYRSHSLPLSILSLSLSQLICQLFLVKGTSFSFVICECVVTFWGLLTLYIHMKYVTNYCLNHGASEAEPATPPLTPSHTAFVGLLTASLYPLPGTALCSCVSMCVCKDNDVQSSRLRMSSSSSLSQSKSQYFVCNVYANYAC